MWLEILNIYLVGVKSNFFELGGYFFLVINLMVKI